MRSNPVLSKVWVHTKSHQHPSTLFQHLDDRAEIGDCGHPSIQPKWIVSATPNLITSSYLDKWHLSTHLQKNVDTSDLRIAGLAATDSTELS